MLNKSKINGIINYLNSNPSKVAKAIGMPYTTIITKMKRGSWTPDDIEMLANYFKKPLDYFFDREEKMHVVNEPAAEYGKKCERCADKDITIESQKETITLQRQKIQYLEHKLENLNTESRGQTGS